MEPIKRGKRVQIFIHEGDSFKGKSVYFAVLEKLR